MSIWPWVCISWQKKDGRIQDFRIQYVDRIWHSSLGLRSCRLNMDICWQAIYFSTCPPVVCKLGREGDGEGRVSSGWGRGAGVGVGAGKRTVFPPRIYQLLSVMFALSEKCCSGSVSVQYVWECRYSLLCVINSHWKVLSSEMDPAKSRLIR